MRNVFHDSSEFYYFFPFKWILFGKWICVFVNQKLFKIIKQKKRKQQQTRCVKSSFIIKMEIYFFGGLNVIIWLSCPKVFCTKHWYCRKLSLVRYLINSIALLRLFSARILDGMWFCVAYKNNNNNNSKRYLLAIIWSYYGMCPSLFLSTKIVLMKTTKEVLRYTKMYINNISLLLL